jgi:hypothetical protein
VSAGPIGIGAHALPRLGLVTRPCCSSLTGVETRDLFGLALACRQPSAIDGDRLDAAAKRRKPCPIEQIDSVRLSVAGTAEAPRRRTRRALRHAMVTVASQPSL